MKKWCGLARIAVLGFVLSMPAVAAETEPLTDMVEIMREEGVIDDAQYSQMREKAARRDAETQWWERLTFSGDMRIRYETFVYNTDSLGINRRTRGRLRYRARLRLDADINDHIDAVIRIATGARDSRSTNQTLGQSFDFGPDGFAIDRAYLVLTPFAEGALPGGESGYLGFEYGRMDNPYHWSKRISPDYMLWDRDIGLEGVQMRAAWDAANTVQLFLNTGYYVISERSAASNPGLLAAQLGAEIQAAEKVRVGTRFSFFGFNNLSTAFLGRGVGTLAGPIITCPDDDADGPIDPTLCRVVLATAAATNSGGNTFAGGSAFGLAKGSSANVVEGGVYVGLDFLEDWPITLFGNVSSNLSAQNLGMGTQSLAWLVGVQVGDKKKFVNAGLLYGSIEADAFPSQFIDSDLTDGRTNRQGLNFWVARQILESTDFKFETFYGEEIERAPLFALSNVSARRWRMRADVQVKF